VQIVAKHIDDDEIDKYKEIFDAIDFDNTGFITHDEFANALRSRFNLPNDVLVRFLEVDTDQTGKISFSEFLTYILCASGTHGINSTIQESILIKAFQTMDPSGTGFIDVTDICDLWNDVTVEESREMLYDVIGHREMADPTLNLNQFLDAFRVSKGKRRTSWLNRFLKN
jgi:Ca2+-binding EF-hand superfamily protein